MKKVKLTKITQRQQTFYALVYDPRLMIKLVNIPAAAVAQAAQRPWKETRVKDIAKYAAGKLKISDEGAKVRYAQGIIPNSPILIAHEKLKVREEGDQVWIDLPSTSEEARELEGTIEILDGQHRLIAFHDDYRNSELKNNHIYEMSFILFKNLSLEDKREIFMICNDKQDKVESNLLRQFKKWLGLLSQDEESLYALVEKLNTESISPLKGRIIVGGEKKTHGLKLVQLTKILKTSKTFDAIKSKELNTQLKAICMYLKAWDNVYNGLFNNPKHILGKISGIRYVLVLFPYVTEILKEQKKKYELNEIIAILQTLHAVTGGIKFFEGEDRFRFRQENATVQLAEEQGELLKQHCLKDQEVYDPLDNV